MPFAPWKIRNPEGCQISFRKAHLHVLISSALHHSSEPSAALGGDRAGLQTAAAAGV